MSISNPETNVDADGEVSAYAGQIANSLSLPMVMQAVIELDLLEIIAGAEASGRRSRRISAREIVDQLPASDKEQAADMVDRMLRLLAAFAVVTYSVVDGGGGRVYGLAPVARFFVRDDKNASFGPYVQLLHDDVLLGGWRKTKEAVLNGGHPFKNAYGMEPYEYTRLDSRFNQVFNRAMFNHTTVVTNKVLQHYKGLENLKQLVDVGGGLGETLKIIVSKYPTIKGINFDLPHVIQHGLPIPGVEHVGGDMFESVPCAVEAILMKWILHNWSDEQCVKVLRNCYDALPKNGKVIILEHVLADELESTTSAKAILLKDVLMMTQCPGGRQRTRKEFTALADAAGLTTVHFACYACNFWVMEFYK